MSVIGPKWTCRNAQSLSLLGVKQTWPIAPQMSAFDPKRTWPLPVRWLKPVRWLVLSLGGGNEAARFYQNCCRLSGSASDYGPRTAARPHTAHRRTLGPGRGRSGQKDGPRRLPAAVAAIGLDRRPQWAD